MMYVELCELVFICFLYAHGKVQVEERLVEVDELLEADEVFCTGTAVVISPVGSITYRGRR